MKIHLKRTGGFANIKHEITLDTDDLPAEESESLRLCIKESNFFSLPDKFVSPEFLQMTDTFKFEITIESDGEIKTVEMHEMHVPEELRRLVKYLTCC